MKTKVRVGTVQIKAEESGFWLGTADDKPAGINANHLTRFLTEGRKNHVVQVIISYQEDQVYRNLDLTRLREELHAVLSAVSLPGERFDVSTATRGLLVEKTVTINFARLTEEFTLETLRASYATH